jgi:hypothetical protein
MFPIRALALAALTTGVALAASAAPPKPAGPIESGRTLTINERPLVFKEAVNACLKLCTNVIVERQTFECAPYFLPSYDGCPLPWIDSGNPNPVPGDLADWCVPSEPEFGGYHLSERVERIERQVRQGADCQTVVTETVLQTLPDRGGAPRACPDRGPWTSSNETVLSIQFVPCR